MLKSFDIAYKQALAFVLTNGVEQVNFRTGTKVLATHGYSLRWNLNYSPIANCRPMFMKTAAAEVAWMLSGEKSTTWINSQCNIWKDFEDRPGIIDSAYGYRWKYKYDIDQVQTIIANLKKDPSSRQQVLLSWHPEDLLGKTKNVPCPYTAVFNIIDGKLNCFLALRSNDMLFGFPYDMLMYTLLSQAIANQLEVEPGELFYTIAHMHLYENQLEAAQAVVNSSPKLKAYEFRHEFTVDQILESRDSFVAHIKSIQGQLGYKPINVTKGLLPEVVV
jgi:thymidylate synthase